MSKRRGGTSRCAFWRCGRVGDIYCTLRKRLWGLNAEQVNTVVSASGHETREAMSYRGATVGLIAVMVFLVLFCYYGGAELWVMFAFFVIYYMISIAITRMRAELGTPVHDLHYSGPDEILTRDCWHPSIGKRQPDYVLYVLVY